jgi:hypothetical protein
MQETFRRILRYVFMLLLLLAVTYYVPSIKLSIKDIFVIAFAGTSGFVFIDMYYPYVLIQ